MWESDLGVRELLNYTKKFSTIFLFVNDLAFIFRLTGPVKNEDQAYPRPLPPALKTALVEDVSALSQSLTLSESENIFCQAAGKCKKFF